MGLIVRSLRKLMLATNTYVDPKESALLELGNQMAFNSLIEERIDKYRISTILHKYFKSYETIDLQNEKNVTITDLSIYQPDLFNVDIITNIGTSEHVEFEKGQWNCWKNIHNWLKIDGIMIHELPELGSWPGHCRYYVTREFFIKLKQYGYQILELDDHIWSDQGNTLWCVIQKVKDVPFMDKDTFFSLMHFDINIPPAGFIESNNPKNLK